ncbi:hypothetical protein NQ317_009553 [Molorchus minor]|uniref:Uncharacterized protein n=1 Tax=Molorchus minor TaxID=1323400 RepID=A0ABQ9JGM0_9CUCU|nr:hypothetical protein NQ317_009553 [Molorchus minor]
MNSAKTILLVAAFFGLAACGRLDSQYLPPNQRQGSSGAGSAAQYSGNGEYSGNGAYSGQSSTNSAAQVPILRLENNDNGDGTYNYVYETGDGISAQEQGDATGDGTKAQGGFSYTAPDGQQIQIQYTADENGFQPQGGASSNPPPVPEEIQRAVEQNLADEARGIFDDGQYKEEQAPSQSYKAAAGQNQYNGQGGQNQYSAPAAQSQYGAQVAQNQFNAPTPSAGQRQQNTPAAQNNQGGYRY